MEIKRSYKDISARISDPQKALPYLGKAAVLNNMIGELPPTTWADIEILDWLPGDTGLPVKYSRYDTPFGEAWIANTPKGICYLGIVDNDPDHLSCDFNKRFGYTVPVEERTLLQKTALDYLNGKTDGQLLFHLKGTAYQVEIWRRLLRIPFGKVISYADLAGNRALSRAAGAANGRNPVFWIVPCHRVVQTDGGFDRYFWGKDIKKRLLAWEFANNRK